MKMIKMNGEDDNFLFVPSIVCPLDGERHTDCVVMRERTCDLWEECQRKFDEQRFGN